MVFGISLPLAHLQVFIEGVPGASKVDLWLPLNPRGRVSLVCPDCRREVRIPGTVAEKEEAFRCPFCLREESLVEALVLAYPKILAPVRERAAAQVQAELGRLLGGDS